MERTNMDPKDSAVMTAAGCAESDSPEEKMAKMAAYARKMEADASQEKEAAAAARKAMEDAAVKPPVAAEGGEDLEARIKAQEEKIAMLLAELAQSKCAMQRFAAMEAKTKEQEAAQFARSAVAMGRIKGDHKGSIEATEKWLAERHVKNPADAEDLLSAEGTFQISERVAMSRLTQKGAGIGAPDPTDAATSPADEVDRLVAAEIKSMQAAGEKGDLTTAAMSRVSKKHPAVWGRYVNRNRGA